MAASNLLPHSCQDCLVFAIDIRKRFLEKDRDHRDVAVVPLGHRNNVTLENILRAAQNGCDLADFLVNDWMSLQDLRSWTEMVGRAKNFNLRAYFITDDPCGTDEITSLDLWENRELDERNLCRSEASFIFYTLEDDPCARFNISRPINQCTDGLKTQTKIQEWVYSCLSGAHKSCEALKPSWMPTRLLHVWRVCGEGFGVRLCRPKDIVPYAALSYCWGGEQFQKTTLQNVFSYHSSISWSILPRTIQDALKVTVRAGINYLWVDSLCIVQDNVNDVEKEIAHMAAIYSQAAFTISASRAVAAKNGFLYDINQASLIDRLFQIPYIGPDSTVGWVYLAVPKNGVFESPLSTRGWALQERCLSPRVLDYGPAQVRWICRSSNASHGFANGWRRDEQTLVNTSDPFKDVEDIKNIPDIDDTGGKHNYEKHLASWRCLVTSYTYRELSVLTDRSLAISGLAERFASFMNDEYVAGLWRKSLVYDLLWYVYGSKKKRPEQYQGPSWSWTGINSPVSFLGDTYWDDRRPGVLDIVHVTIQLSEPSAKFGALRYGVLRVSRRLQPAKLNTVGKIETLEGETLHGVWYNDNLEDEVLTDMGVDLLQVRSRDPPHENHRSGLFGLVLHKTHFKGSGHVSRYRRLGLFILHYGPSAEEIERFEHLQIDGLVCPELFDTCAAQIIEIV